MIVNEFADWRRMISHSLATSIKACFVSTILGLSLAATPSDAVEPLYPQKTSEKRASELKATPWIEVIEREVPSLKNNPGERMPMIMWQGVGFEPLSPRQIGVLRQRGLTQHLQMDAAMIPAALRLQEAGMPVILMQGRTDSWPYSLAENSDDWAHQFDATYQPKWLGDEHAFQWHGACPDQTAGFLVLETQTRNTVQQFRDAGVKVNGVWMDFEGDPYPWSHLFDQLKHCQRCRQELPAEIRNDKAAWRGDAWQRYVSLYDQHFAKPIREVFPDCLVTNWHVVVSTQANPVRYFVSDVKLPVLSPEYFSATNPIAYASDAVWNQRHSNEVPLTQTLVDDFFEAEILQQVKTDHENRVACRQGNLTAVPWVARYCRIETSGQPTPMMSRTRYRTALANLWQYDVASMQIFNAMHDGYEELALTELQDAVLAYDESLR
jgi:hypothetical protein